MLFTLNLPAVRIAEANGDTRTLSLHHIHTGEDITITYKVNGKYDEAALKKLDHFVRDWRKNQEVHMDPRLFDMLWEVQHAIGYKRPIDIVCGYRSPATNAMLRARSSGVARTSLHMRGQAMDVSFPGADVAVVRAAALRIQGGGVGYYPTSGVPFVHMDTGNVRHWPRMTREQLAKIFPDGRTLHIPKDGHPLPGYALALADAEHGTTDRLLYRPKARNLLASLFKNKPDAEELADQVSLQQPMAPSRRAVASLAPVVAAAELKPVPLPLRRPAFEVASYESRPVPKPLGAKPLGAMRVATLTPNQVIDQRGYWQGPQDTAPVHVSATRRTDEPDLTAAIGTPAPRDHVPLDVALAYASQDVPHATATPAAGPAIVTLRGSTAIAVKPPEPARPLRAVRAASRLNDPWMRGLMLASRLNTAMTVTTFGPPDLRSLQTFMQKPASSVMMTFSADPYLGMTTDKFTGSAVVFQATVTYSMRTAALQR